MTVRGGAFAIALLAAGCASPFDRALDHFLADVQREGGRAGIAVVDVPTGRVLAEHAADDGFVPASTLKLLTAATALRTLGPDATLRTELWARGEVGDGVLRGDLVLRGFGDPTLGVPADDPRLDALATAVRALGVRRIAGAVRGDGSWLGDERHGRGWEWEDLDEVHAAPFGGLCCGGNVVDAGDGRRVPVADPAAHAAATFAARLAAIGITVGGGAAQASGRERLVAAVESVPLAALLVPLLADSDNLAAEQLWRAAARVATGDGGSEAASAHALRELAALGVDVRGLVFADGSGLSRLDLVRPRQLATLLCRLHAQPWWPTIHAALPRSGERGTLRARLADGPARGIVFAKTGTLTRVTALAGYLLHPARPPLAFAVVWNDHLCDTDTARRTVDAFVQQLAAAAGS